MMDRLRECNLTFNPRKCEIGMNKIIFMGHILSQTSNEVAVEAETHTSYSEVKAFLFFVNFSARYIPNLSSISEPLPGLTEM